MPPAQSRTPSVVPVRRNPLGPGFNGQRGEICIRHEITFGAGFSHESLKNGPVPIAGSDLQTVGVLANLIYEGEGRFDWRRIGEYLWMGDNSQESA